MKKELFINGQKFCFTYVENESDYFWYLGNDAVKIFDIGSDIDITIRGRTVLWEDVELFLHFILSEKENMKNCIEKSNKLLCYFFKELFSTVYSTSRLNDIYFGLGNITYIEKKVTNQEITFQYKLDFYLESNSDPNIFSYDTWSSLFVNYELVGILRA